MHIKTVLANGSQSALLTGSDADQHRAEQHNGNKTCIQNTLDQIENREFPHIPVWPLLQRVIEPPVQQGAVFQHCMA